MSRGHLYIHISKLLPVHWAFPYRIMISGSANTTISSIGFWNMTPTWMNSVPKYGSLFRLSQSRALMPLDIQGLPTGDWTTALRWTPDDTLWCTTVTGFFRIRAEGTRFKATAVVLPGLTGPPSVNTLELAPDGSLWVGTDAGLFRWAGGRWTHLGKADGLAAEDVSGAFAGPGGEWWVLHGASKAITRFKRDPGQGWRVAGQFTARDTLAVDGAAAGWTAPDGVVWLVGDHCVARWDGKHLDRFSRGFGLPIDNLFPSICGGPDGTFWVGSISGAIHCDPRYYRPIPEPPALVQGPALDGEGHPFQAQARIPYRKTGVTFELELPLVEGIEALQIQTRVRGLDETWHPLVGNLLRLPGLPPGAYTLEAHAGRLDGPTGPTLRFPFEVLQPWYFRPSTLVLGALLLAVLVVLLFRWRTWTLRREQARLESVVSQRTRDLLASNQALTTALGEVRTLKGLVPICSYCKRIRSDEGFWRQLEQVLAERTEAQLSHGICPECAPKVRAAWEAEQAAFNPLPRQKPTSGS